jgi:hypothetical protein
LYTTALGLDHAHGFFIDKQHVVRRADIGLVFTYRLSPASIEVDLFIVLNSPARLP